MDISRKSFLRAAGASALIGASLAVTSAPSAQAATPTFTDLAPGQAFYKEITWAAEQGIIRGWADGTVRPHAAVERGAMAAFLYRLAGNPGFNAPAKPSFVDVPTTHVFYKEIEWMKAGGITTGWPDGTFRPQIAAERGAVATFMYRTSH